MDPGPEVVRAAPGSTQTGRARRVDARRNLEAILEAARVTLPARPDASMQELAAAAGVHRATVHRHFAARDDLITALRARAVDETVEGARDALTGGTGPAAGVIEQTSVSVLRVAQRFRLFRFTTWRDPVTEERGAAVTVLMREAMLRAQQEGGARADLEVDELYLIWAGLIEALSPPVAEGTMGLADAASLIRRALAPA